MIIRKLKAHHLGILLLVLAVMLTGCGGSSSSAALAATSWPGVTVFDGTVYIAAGPQVYAVIPEASRGVEYWAFPAKPARGQAFYAAPAVDDELVVVVDYTDSMFALDRATGDQKWVFRSDRARFIGGAVLGEQYIYAGAANGTLYAVDRRDGSQVWSYTTGRDIWSTPLLSEDGTLYVTSLDRHLYAIDAETGNLKWQFPEPDADSLTGAIVGTPTLHNGVLYFGCFDNHLYAVDIETHETLWTYRTTNWIWSSPVVDEESGLLIGGDLDGHVFAIDLETHEQEWIVETGGPVVSTPAIVEQDDGTRVALVTSGDTNVYMLNAESGVNVINPVSIQAEFTTRFIVIQTGTSIRPIPIYAPPVVYDEFIFLGAHQGNHPLIALDRENLSKRWGFPTN